MHILNRFYTFINSYCIEEFLASNEFLTPFLLEGYRQIKKVFENSIVDISIEYISNEGFEGIFITITTSVPPKESLDLLDVLDNTWWLDVNYETRKIVEIGIRSKG